jgi:hypothetical protein
VRFVLVFLRGMYVCALACLTMPRECIFVSSDSQMNFLLLRGTKSNPSPSISSVRTVILACHDGRIFNQPSHAACSCASTLTSPGMLIRVVDKCLSECVRFSFDCHRGYCSHEESTIGSSLDCVSPNILPKTHISNAHIIVNSFVFVSITFFFLGVHVCVMFQQARKAPAAAVIRSSHAPGKNIIWLRSSRCIDDDDDGGGGVGGDGSGVDDGGGGGALWLLG